MGKNQSVKDSLAYLNEHGAHVEYYPDFLSPAEADHYWQKLFDELKFNSEERVLYTFVPIRI